MIKNLKINNNNRKHKHYIFRVYNSIGASFSPFFFIKNPLALAKILNNSYLSRGNKMNYSHV